MRRRNLALMNFSNPSPLPRPRHTVTHTRQRTGQKAGQEGRDRGRDRAGARDLCPPIPRHPWPIPSARASHRRKGRDRERDQGQAPVQPAPPSPALRSRSRSRSGCGSGCGCGCGFWARCARGRISAKNRKRGGAEREEPGLVIEPGLRDRKGIGPRARRASLHVAVHGYTHIQRHLS
jgi:hypothetical protein